MLNLGGGEGELSGQVAVASAELRIAGDEPVVLGRSAAKGGGGGSVFGDLSGDLGVAPAEGGIGQVKAAGRHEDTGLAAGLGLVAQGRTDCSDEVYSDAPPWAGIAGASSARFADFTRSPDTPKASG